MPQQQDPFASQGQPHRPASRGTIAGRSSTGMAGRSSANRSMPAQRPSQAGRRKPTPQRYATPKAPLSPFAGMQEDPFDTPYAQQAQQGSFDPFDDFDDVTAPPQGKTKKQKKQNQIRQPKQKNGRAKAQMREDDNGGLFQRIRTYFRMSSPKTVYLDFLGWIVTHPYILFVICVAFIAIGMLFGRYYSVGCAFVLAILGALMSKENFDTTSYICYGVAFADFFIPYLL